MFVMKNFVIQVATNNCTFHVQDIDLVERESGSCHTFADTTHYTSTSRILQSEK